MKGSDKVTTSGRIEKEYILNFGFRNKHSILEENRKRTIAFQLRSARKK